MSTLSHTRHRTTVPSLGRYTAISATCPQVPHTPQVPTAVVISAPNTSISIPPIALPSSTLSSSGLISHLLETRESRGARRAEPLGLDPLRRVAERNQVRGHRLHEVRRPAYVSKRPRSHRPGHLGHHLLVPPPRVTGPARRLLPGQRVDHLYVVCGRIQLRPVDHVGLAAHRVQQADRYRTPDSGTVPEHGP